MSARRRGVVMRGGAACKWDGRRYVRLFAAKRGRHLAALIEAVEDMAAPLFGEPASGMDAPDLLPGGGNAQLLGRRVFWRAGGGLAGVR